jgi:putative resolvase
MDGLRAKVRRLLADPGVTAVVVEHRDRLGRMNTGLVESALAAHGRRLVVLDDCEVDDDLVRDMVEVLTSCCARLYGRRCARNRALKAGSAARSVTSVHGLLWPLKLAVSVVSVRMAGDEHEDQAVTAAS